MSRDHPLHGSQALRELFEREREEFVAAAQSSLTLDPLDHDFSQHWLYRLYIETNLFWDFDDNDQRCVPRNACGASSQR